MAVSSQCQGLGIGKNLLTSALDFANAYGYQEILLETSHNQQQAIKFYERNGFVDYDGFVKWPWYIPFYIHKFRYESRSKET